MTKLLELSGKELEKELDRIASENPSNYRYWTTKEIDIVKSLRAKGVPTKKIAGVIGRTRASVDYLVNKSPYYE
jgi:hypothetical protein